TPSGSLSHFADQPLRGLVFSTRERHPMLDTSLESACRNAPPSAFRSSLAFLLHSVTSPRRDAKYSMRLTTRRCSRIDGRGMVNSKKRGGFRVNFESAADPIDICLACSQSEGWRKYQHK